MILISEQRQELVAGSLLAPQFQHTVAAREWDWGLFGCADIDTPQDCLNFFALLAACQPACQLAQLKLFDTSFDSQLTGKKWK